MREIAGHAAGRIFLAVLTLSIIAMFAAVSSGMMETAPGEAPVLVFGWMTLPLVVGVLFVLVWLVAYLVYFFKFWPYR